MSCCTTAGYLEPAADIDHLVVAPSGVWIVDTKHYQGRVERRDVGGWHHPDHRLYVAGRHRTRLVTGMTNQIAAVADALGAAAGVAVCPVLCFTCGDWSLLAKPFDVGGVVVTWPKELCRRIARANRVLVPVPGLAVCLATGLPACWRATGSSEARPPEGAAAV